MTDFEMFLSGGDEFGQLSETELLQMSPLVMAYMGDAIYEAFIRNYLVKNFKHAVHKLHKLSVTFVSAKAQATIAHNLVEKLKDEEKDILRRARNTKTASSPKNSDITTYRYATGFEAVIGYLYCIYWTKFAT